MSAPIFNGRGTRAFDPRAAQVLTWSLAAGMFSLAGTDPAHALPREYFEISAAPQLTFVPKHAAGAATVSRRHRRSRWTVRWERRHRRGWTRRAYRHGHSARWARGQARHWRKTTIAERFSPRQAPHKPFLAHARPTPSALPPRFAALPIKFLPHETHSKTAPADDVTLDFVGADINDVLKALAVQTRVSIVSGRDVSGTVTVSLAHVTLESALNLITKVSGYQFARVGRAYLVGSPASIATLAAEGKAVEPPITAVLPFRYADPKDLTKRIEAEFPDVSATPGPARESAEAGGVLVVCGVRADVEGVRVLIARQEIAHYEVRRAATGWELLAAADPDLIVQTASHH